MSETQIWTAPADGGEPELVFATHDVLLEAPNWAPDGGALILNGDGVLWRLTLPAGAAGAAPDAPTHAVLEHVPTEALPPINNDHVLDPDGVTVHCSGTDGHVYRVPLAGGRAERETPDDGLAHFLHGVSPTGSELAFVTLPVGDFRAAGRLVVLDLAAGTTTQRDVGSGHCDGPEFAPDGRWILLNTESFTDAPGHAQLARVPADGSGPMERLHTSDRVDWFPHLAPDGSAGVYISFPPGTLGHPGDVDVELVLVGRGSDGAIDWSTDVRRTPLHGGQGTINVNSWAPDASRYAYVAYPVA